MMRSSVRLSSLVLAALAVASPVLAQTPQSQRPYRGLFANGRADAAESLTATGSIGGGWDTNIALDIDPDSPASAEPSRLRSAGYNMFSGALAYENYGRRATFGSSFATSGRYYPNLSNPLLAGYSAAVNLGYQISRSTALNLSEVVSYQPFGSLNIFPGLQTSSLQQPESIQAATAPILDVRALNTDILSTNSAVGISRQLSSRSNVSANYNYQASFFGNDRGTFSSHSAFGRFTRSITQNLGLRLGYGYTRSQFAQQDGRFSNHQLDTGVDYNRVLSVSRRTSVGFSTGATAFSNGQSTRYAATGNAQILHEIGRTWGLSGTYQRGVQFVNTLNQPLFTDAVNASLGGLVSDRVSVNAGVGAASGNLGFSATANDLWSYYGTAGIGVALNRHLSVGSSYYYYRYTLDGAAFGQLGFADDLTRHSISVFLSAWAPIFQKGQRANASR